ERSLPFQAAATPGERQPIVGRCLGIGKQ
ncbi:hypothetical protein CCACVL1_01877, partial [Corchorus capsularis]